MVTVIDLVQIEPKNGFETEKVKKGYRQCGYLPQPPTSLLEWRPSGPRRVALNPSSGMQFVNATLLGSDGNSLGCPREGYPMRLRRCANKPCKYAKEPCRYAKEPCKYAKEPCSFEKEPCRYAKEPCRHAKEHAS